MAIVSSDDTAALSPQNSSRGWADTQKNELSLTLRAPDFQNPHNKVFVICNCSNGELSLTFYVLLVNLRVLDTSIVSSQFSNYWEKTFTNFKVNHFIF